MILEREQVNVRTLRAQRVTTGYRGDGLSAEYLAKPERIGPHSAECALRRLVTPQSLYEFVGGRDPTGARREQCQDGLLLRRPHLEFLGLPSGIVHPQRADRSEEPELNHH
jgi:hypothetical protein